MTVARSRLARAEAEAGRRARMLESLLACIPHGVCIYGPDRRVALTNRAYAEVMRGVPLAIGDHLEDVIRRLAEAGEYGPGQPAEVFAQQMAFDITRPQRRRRRRPNGMVIDERTAPLPDGGHFIVASDVTPLTNAEDELTRRAAEMEMMLASIRHGIMLWGADRRLVASNRVAYSLLGVPSSMLAKGRGFDEIVDDVAAMGDPTTASARAAAAEAIKAHCWHTPFLQRFTSFANRFVEARGDPKPEGGLVVTLSDMTEARAAEFELRRAKEAAEAASQAKSRFLAAMSHELRTPLNAVIGFSEALQRDSGQPTATRVAEFAQAINEAGRDLLKLVNVILDVASLEAGRFDLGSDLIDLSPLVRKCLRQADSVAQAGHITLIADLPETLPSIRGDKRRLAQVVDQLLSNALKFTAPGGTVTLSAFVDPERRTGHACCRYRNWHPGARAGAGVRTIHPVGRHSCPPWSGRRARPICRPSPDRGP